VDSGIPAGFAPIPTTLDGGNGGVGSVTGGAPEAGSSSESDFMSTLRNAMDQVGELQSEADTKVAQLLTGNGQDVHSTMIAVQKANLAFEMMVAVRNKIVQAYQQISGIPF
jgi:flagellar hook-basal body complex protein FliE